MICVIGTEDADAGVRAVVLSAVITMAIFTILTIFTCQSKIDFSFMGAVCIAAVSEPYVSQLCLSGMCHNCV
jgi:hypothetical protein